MEWVALALRRGGLRWLETDRFSKRGQYPHGGGPWCGVVDERGGVGQVTVECWKAAVVSSGCGRMVGARGVGRVGAERLDSGKAC